MYLVQAVNASDRLQFSFMWVAETIDTEQEHKEDPRKLPDRTPCVSIPIYT